ncbi:MAG: DUF1848 family protein [Roseburia sp.]
MIISTGSRTDVPAYFSAWFCARIRAGFVCARNPYYPGRSQGTVWTRRWWTAWCFAGGKMPDVWRA